MRADIVVLHEGAKTTLPGYDSSHQVFIEDLVSSVEEADVIIQINPWHVTNTNPLVDNGRVTMVRSASAQYGVEGGNRDLGLVRESDWKILLDTMRPYREADIRIHGDQYASETNLTAAQILGWQRRKHLFNYDNTPNPESQRDLDLMNRWSESGEFKKSNIRLGVVTFEEGLGSGKERYDLANQLVDGNTHLHTSKWHATAHLPTILSKVKEKPTIIYQQIGR